MSVNGGGETHIYRFDTKTNALRADLDSIDHLTFEKGSKVMFLFNNYLDKDRRNLSALCVCTKSKCLCIQVRFRGAFQGTCGGTIELFGETAVSLSDPSDILAEKMREKVKINIKMNQVRLYPTCIV